MPAALPASLRARAQKAARQSRRYLTGRQSPGGGFCFYRWLGVEEPALRDTWHAVAALTLLGADVPHRDDIIAFLRGFRDTGFDDLYHRTLALRRLGATTDADAIARIRDLDAAACLAKPGVPIGARLQRALRIVMLQRALAPVDNLREIAGRTFAMCHDGGWGDKPNLIDTWFALAILQACGRGSASADTLGFVDALQLPSFGFTATRDSTHAPLEVLHAGLRVCALLHASVRHRSDAVGGVLACQSGNGGFARGADALPDIALTHLALLALAAAGALSVPASPGWQNDSGE